MRIDSNNWRAEAPELYKFDLTDPTARLVAADYAQERGDEALAGWLRRLTPLVPLDFPRAAHLCELMLRPAGSIGHVYTEIPAGEYEYPHETVAGLAQRFVLCAFLAPHENNWRWVARVAPAFPGASAPAVSVFGDRNPYAALLGLVLATRSAYRHHRGPDDPAAVWAGLTVPEAVVNSAPSPHPRPVWWRRSF